MTVLTYLGHACFLFETEKAAILVDPWFSPAGAFLGTWRQLPVNAQGLETVIAKAGEKPLMVYLTHEHEDHYDEASLKKILPHCAGLYVPRYENGFLLRLIERNLGVTPHLVGEDSPQHFHDIAFTVFIDESGINRDSAILLKSAGLSFFNVNDCKIYDRAPWLRERCGALDILSVQFSGANMHPVCYEMGEEEYKNISRQKRQRKFVAVRNFIRTLEPRFYLPSAGPAVFPGAAHEALNFQQDSIFPRWPEFRDWLEGKAGKTRFVALDPGGRADVRGGAWPVFEGLAREMTDDDLRAAIGYYRTYDAQNLPAALPGRKEVLAFFTREMNAKLAVLKNHPKTKFGCDLYFEIAEEGREPVFYRADTKTFTLEETTAAAIVPPFYHHVTSVAALGALMRSGKGWGTYFLSFLFRSRRVPDTFDSALGTFFVANDDDDLDFGLRKLAEFRDSDEYVTLRAPDGRTEVTCKRFCPHQGADLKYAGFDGRHVTCPRHQWKFDCADGGKADNSADTIDAKISSVPDKARA